MPRKKVKVVVCRVGKKAEVEEIDTNLRTLQKLVGGYISCLHLGASVHGMDGIDLWSNDEGLYTQPLNRSIPAVAPELPEMFKEAVVIKTDPDLADPGQPGVWRIHGDFFLARSDNKGEMISLESSDIDKVIELMDRCMVQQA